MRATPYALRLDCCRAGWVVQLKAASTAIKTELARLLGLPSRTDLDWCEPQEIPRHYYAFTVVRHPLERVRSGWADRVRRYGLYGGMSWSNFVSMLSMTSDDDVDVHFKGQKYAVDMCSAPVEVFRYEDLDVDWAALTLRLRERGGRLGPLQRMNECRGDKPGFTHEQVSLLKQRYAADFAAFGYY